VVAEIVVTALAAPCGVTELDNAGDKELPAVFVA
jgi:hypothetical protein